MRTVTPPRPPVVIQEALADPEVLNGILQRESPHPMTLAGEEFTEARAALRAAAADGTQPTFVDVVGGEPRIPGVFRTTWGAQDNAVEGADVIVHNPRFIQAAKQLFDAEIIRPYFTYVNINTPGGQLARHTDIPAFRGISRESYPTWLLNSMQLSGLFDPWQVRIATAVAWYYEGPGGEFSYWPEGWDGPGVTVDPPVNYCLMGDNDLMPHGVEAMGPGPDYPKYGFDATITLTPDREWIVHEPGHDPVQHAFDEVRVSLSWKAFVFVDAEQMEIYDRHLDDLDAATVVERLVEDCARHDVRLPDGPDALSHPDFGHLVRQVYLAANARY